jgi:hypothetical protein
VPKLRDWYTFSAAPVRDEAGRVVGAIEVMQHIAKEQRDAAHFDLMRTVSRAEWDTLLFFYGVILGVGGLAQFGYLTALSSWLYGTLGPTGANTAIGVVSAVIDNIPVMFAVLTMDPDMSLSQWLLVTLTTGVGGSMLAIGSAAGVALMGTARGLYTFGAHLRWTPAIALGYAAAGSRRRCGGSRGRAWRCSATWRSMRTGRPTRGTARVRSRPGCRCSAWPSSGMASAAGIGAQDVLDGGGDWQTLVFAKPLEDGVEQSRLDFGSVQTVPQRSRTCCSSGSSARCCAPMRWSSTSRLRAAWSDPR